MEQQKILKRWGITQQRKEQPPTRTEVDIARNSRKITSTLVFNNFGTVKTAASGLTWIPLTFGIVKRSVTGTRNQVSQYRIQYFRIVALSVHINVVSWPESQKEKVISHTKFRYKKTGVVERLQTKYQQAPNSWVSNSEMINISNIEIINFNKSNHITIISCQCLCRAMRIGVWTPLMICCCPWKEDAIIQF